MSIVIPSYRRGAVVLDTLDSLLSLTYGCEEILVIDQTEEHPEDVHLRLQRMHDSGKIVWVRLDKPSIPAAMNHGLRAASGDAVIFLDDDIIPDPCLIEMHRAAQAESVLVAGQVLQPGQKTEALHAMEAFRFNSPDPAWIDEFMGGNFSINRVEALKLGGFDENFVGAAYRFEAEFAHRYLQAHGRIRYEPRALIHHLAVSSGGTRAHGNHLRTLQPAHSVGEYYFLLTTHRAGWLREAIKRPFRSVRTRHHLLRPWWIPLTLIAEARGYFLARRLLRAGPRLIAAATLDAGESA